MGEGDKRCAYIITLPLSVHEEDALQEGAEQVARVSPTLSSSTKSLRSEKRADPRSEGDTGLAGLLESD